MIGSGSLLVFFLLTASPDDAGLATVSDRTPAIGTTVPADNGEATPVNYVVMPPEGDAGSDSSPSLLQAMLQDQDRNRSENPFKDEGPAPGNMNAEPPRQLPPVPANRPLNPPALPQRTTPATPSTATPPGMAWAGDGGCGPGCRAADSNAANGCQSTAISRCRKAICNWSSDISYDAWIDQGATINPFSPRDRSNFPVGFNNRSNEYQLNQAYLRLQRDVNTQDGRWDVGGAVDLLYGTDSFYASSRGLEVNRDFSPKWNAQQYGAAMPQCYMEVFAPWGDDGMTMKLGHFYTILGYETTTAPENFFYSHSFCLIYGEPVTETGLLAEKKVGNFKIHAGVTRGWDNWEDNNNDLSFLGGLHWTDDDNCTSLAFMMQSGPEQNEPPQNVNFRNVFSLVLQQKLADRFQYVGQVDYGYEERGDIYHLPPAKWLGLNQYIFYTINEKWKAGLRCEWFRDKNGVRVPGGRPDADYYELTAGLNWTPHSRVVVRPELRYDWVGTPNYTPYCDASKSYQLLLDCDVIVKF